MANAIEIAAAVRAGERSAVDVLEEHLAAIAAREERDPRLQPRARRRGASRRRGDRRQVVAGRAIPGRSPACRSP